MFRRLALRVPEDDVAAFLAFHGGEVRVDLARADLRVCERDRDICKVSLEPNQLLH